MKKIKLFALLILVGCYSKAQDASSIFTTGLEDSERFAKEYVQPGVAAFVHSMNAGWFNSAEAKPILGFEISIIGNVAQVATEHQTFNFETSENGGLQYVDGSSSKDVASILGVNENEIVMEYTVTDPTTGLSETIQFTLPESLLDENIDYVPSGFIQGAIGLFKGTEAKVRWLPQTEIDGKEIGLLGVGVQHEFTKWLPADKLWPVAISGLVAYTHLNAQYDVNDEIDLMGENQRFENSISTWLFQAIVSTRLPVINFYGGVGYITGKSESDLKGEYVVYEGFGQQATVSDPIGVDNHVSGLRTTLGTKLKLGFFRLNADYTFADFNTLSLGINFGFR